MLLYFLLTKACRVWNDFFYCNTSIPVAIDCGSLPSIKNGAVDFFNVYTTFFLYSSTSTGHLPSSYLS